MTDAPPTALVLALDSSITVGGQSFAQHLFHVLVAAGVRDAVVCVRAATTDPPHCDGPLRVELVACRGKDADAAVAMRTALQSVRSDPVLVVVGDAVCEFELDELIACQTRYDDTAAMVVSAVADAGRLGTVVANADGRVLGVSETGFPGPGWVDARMYLVPRDWLASLPAESGLQLRRDVLPSWYQRGLYAHRAGGRFMDVADAAGLREAERVLGAPPPPRRVVLLDRDGTVIVDRDYLSDPEDLVLLPGALAGLRKLQDAGLGLVLVTNQSGVGRGYFSEQRLEEIHGRLIELLADGGVALDGIYVCPHVPDDGCTCRKPAPGLVWRAMAELEFDPRAAFVIGDKPSDIELAHRLGAFAVLVRTGYGREHEHKIAARCDLIVDDLADAAEELVLLAEM